MKDPSELYLRSSGDFLVQWKQAVASAVPWTSIDQERRATKAAAHYLAAASLLNAPDLLNQVGLAMRLRGYAGDLTLPTLIYVGLTSRELERPQNLAVIAPSAAGKNRAVDAALELIPPEAHSCTS